MADTQQIHVWELRRRFNCGGYEKKIRSGELIEEVKRTKITQNTWLPSGTQSQMVWYRDANNNKVAEIHRFLQPDGKIAASGRPDPKALVVDNIKFTIFHKDKKLPLKTICWGCINAIWSQFCKWIDCASVKLFS